MSRSYKKFPVCKQPANKYVKRCANKKVRRTLDIPNGGSYRKCFESWDISDWCWIWTKDQAIKDWESTKDDPKETLEEYLQYWEKCTKRK